MERESRHQCLIYEGAPSQQLPALAARMQRKLEEGHRCLYLNSRPMVAGMRSYLAALGVDVVAEIAKTRLVMSSEPVTSVGGGFDIDSMLYKLEEALDRALSDGYKGLWVTGDMTWEFGDRKDFSKLMLYEWRLEELFRQRQALHGICQYHRDTLPHDVVRQSLLTHRTIFINDTLSRLNPHYVPFKLSSGRAEENADLDETITELCQLQSTQS